MALVRIRQQCSNCTHWTRLNECRPGSLTIQEAFSSSLTHCNGSLARWVSLVFFDSGPFLFCRHTRVMELYRARRHRQDNISCTWKSLLLPAGYFLYSRALPTRIIRARRRSCEESSGRFPVFHNPLSILV
jgi:hypothetical protein